MIRSRMHFLSKSTQACMHAVIQPVSQLVSHSSRSPVSPLTSQPVIPPVTYSVSRLFCHPVSYSSQSVFLPVCYLEFNPFGMRVTQELKSSTSMCYFFTGLKIYCILPHWVRPLCSPSRPQLNEPNFNFGTHITEVIFCDVIDLAADLHGRQC